MTLDQTRLPARRVPTVPQPCLLTGRLGRAALLGGTALQAAVALTVAIVPAHAQPAPNARPQGGHIVAGSAAIAHTPGNTVINQFTDRAAIDWHSFNVGRDQAVTFQQPSAASATLNRVAGPDPSAIAGRITANGQFILTNPNGVTFFRGAQVNAQSVIVSAPGITNQNFLAGRMVFDGKVNANARIDNAGTITVKQAGLAALVAPSVANSGTINARLGQVVLAGAAAHTLDMYGDGLVSIDVTKQVRQGPTGPDGNPVTALVTNTGTIVADGGTIQLTARAADGVVQTLVDARGTLQANTLDAKTGRIEIAGTGGSIVIAGRIATDAPGGKAGTIVLNGSAATTLADTAHITADGRTGGGTIAVGTTLVRARSLGPAPAATSARTTVAPGARISANATASGNGGRVTVLSTAATGVAGHFEARGGAQSGNGGTVEFSGEAGFTLTGHADTSAPYGTRGTVVLDPRDLLITSSPPSGTPNQVPATTDPNIAANAGGTTADAYVTPAQLQSLTGNLRLLTTRDLTVASPLNYTAGGVVLEAGRNLTIGANGSVTAAGNLTLAAASTSIPGFDPAGAMSIAGAISGQSIILSAGTGGIAISSSATATATIGISTVGALTQAAGTITTPQLYGTAGSVSLAGNNAIDGVGNGTNASFQTTSGGFLLTGQPGRTLTIGSAGGGGGLFVAAGQPVTLTVDGLVLNAAGAGKSITAPGGTLLLQAADADRPFLVSATNSGVGAPVFLSLPTLSRLSIGTLQIGTNTTTNGGITLGQTAEAVDLAAAGIGKLVLGTRGAVSQGGALTVSDLGVSALSGTDLSNPGNRIGTLSNLAANGPTTITTAGNLALTGSIGSDVATITAGGSITQSATSILTASASVTLSAGDSVIPGADPQALISLAGTIRVANTLNLSAGSGGIALTGSALVTDLVVATPGALTQGTTFLNVTTLSGRAGSVNLSSATNGIVGVDNFAVTGATGDFLLVNRDLLTVGAASSSTGISTQQGRNIFLATDSLALGTGSTSGGPALSAPGGQVNIQPYTASTPILLTTSTKPTGTLALTATELAGIDASQLTLGGVNPGTGLQNTGTITLGQPNETIDLTNAGFNTLGLNTSGAVVQGGPLYVPQITAGVGSLTLDTGGNLVGTIAGVSATGDVALHTNGNLSVGYISTGGNINLSSSGPNGMTLFGDVTGRLVNLNSLSSSIANPTPNDPGITQTGGTITATTLTGAAGVAQLTSVNAVRNLGDFVTYGGLQLNDGANPLAITGAVSSTTGAISLSAAGLTQTATSSIVSPELDGAATADTVLTAAGNAVAAVGTFTQSAGSFTLATSAPTLVLGSGGGQISAAAGSLSFFADGVALAPATRTVPAVSAPSGTVNFAPYTTSRRIEVIGPSAADPNALSIGPAVLAQISAQRLGLGLGRATTDPIGIGNAGETIDLRTRVGSLVLQTTGAVTQGANATLAVPTLAGTAGSIALPSTTNAIAASSGLAASAGPLVLQTSGDLAAANTTATGALTLGAGGNLTLSSALSAGGALTLTAGGGVATTASITSPTIAISGATGITQGGGSLASTGVTTLSAPGRAITQTGGTIAAGTLVTTSATLALPGANNVTTASIAASGTVTLNDTAALTLTALSASDATIDTAAGLTLNGGITASGTLTLRAGGAITQPGGSVSAATLSTASSAQTTLGQQNAIATLASATSTGGLTIVDAGALTVTGPVADATSVALRTGGDLVLAGPVTTGAFTVAVGGALTQTAAIITATSLTGTALSASLTQPNAIAGLGNFATTGNFAVTDATALAITGTVTAGSPTGPAQTISLVTAGDLIETSTGALVAATLTGSAATATLTGGNQVVTLGGFSTTGDLTFANRGDLGVAGPVAGANITLSSTGNMALSGNITSPGLTTLTASAVTQPGGTLTTNTLALTASSTATLGQQNAIGTLAATTSNGGLTIVDAGALTVTGPVADQTAVTLRTGGALTLAGPITTGTLAIAAGGAVTQTAGVVTANSLGGTAGSAAFTQANAIATLTGFTTTGSFALTDSAALTIAGSVTAGTGQTIALTTGTLTFGPGAALIAPGGTVSLAEFTPGRGITLGGNSLPVTAARLSIGSPTAGPITITGVFDLPGGTLDLQSGGTITETGTGAVRAAALTGRASSATLTGANQVGTLGSFATTGNLTFGNAADLAVTGPVTAANVTLSSAGTLAFSGAVTTSGTLTLTAPGAITQPGGTLTAATLTGSAGSLALTGPNAIATLNDITSAGSVALTDTSPLAITGNVTAGAGQTIALRTDALSFAPGSALIAPGGAITLAEATPGVGISLSGSPSTISASTVTLGSVTGGPLTLTGLLDLPGVTLDLQSASAITETGAGAIRAAGLTGRAATVTLTGANQVGTLGRFATSGDFTSANATDLAVAGPVTGGTIRLSSAGNLALSGTLATPGTLTLTATGAITQRAGSLTAAALTGSAFSAILDQPANSVPNLAGFTTTGDFTYSNNGNLAVTALVDPNTVTLNVAGSLTIASVIAGTNVVLNVRDGIAETASGQVVATTLSGSADNAALTGPNQVDTIGGFASANGFALNTTRALTVIGPLTDQAGGVALTAPSIDLAGPLSAPSLTVATSGALGQSGGPLSIGTLTGTANNIDLGNRGSASIGTLGALTAATTLAINDASALRIAGPVAAPALTIAATGALVLDGGALRTNGQPFSAQLGATPAAGGSNLAVRPGASGTASLVQRGTTTLTSLSGGSPTLRFDLPAAGGNLLLNDLQAPGGGIVLSLGSGNATGTLNASQLAILGTGGRANLTGQIGNRTDPSAAQLAQLLPGTDLRYTFNQCAIAAATCSSEIVGTTLVPSAAIASILRPDILSLDVLDLSVTRDRDDPTLLLPNISAGDY